MAVNLTIAKTLTGSAVSDSLSGGSTGLDLGQVINSQFTPIINQGSNLGHQDLYCYHDGIEFIDDFKMFVSPYTGTYGGANTAIADIATLIAKGQSDNELTANNSDGLASGLRVEQAGISIGALGANAFLPSRAQVNIFGNNGTDGISLASAFNLHVDALVYDNASVETDATTPETGKIGPSGDSILGDQAHTGWRFMLENSAPDGGILQWDTVFAYSFTA